MQNHPQQTPTYRKTAVLVGLLFLTSTITFSIGSSLIQEYFSGENAQDLNLLSGVLLEAYTALAVAAISLLLYPILKKYGKRLAPSYVSLRAIECIAILGVGWYFLRSKVWLENYDLLIYTFTSIGGIILSYLLYISRLVPKYLSLLGIIGYIVLLLGIPTDLSGLADLDSNTGILFFTPGGLFEIVLPLWLFIKGFGSTPRSS